MGKEKDIFIGKVHFQSGSSTRIVIDADPYVMGRIRNFFQQAASEGEGQYTHKRISMHVTRDVAKDVLWINERFPMKIEPGVLELLQSKSDEYDKAIVALNSVKNDTTFKPTEGALKLSKKPLDTQVSFLNFIKYQKKTLLADEMGVGKTGSAISLIAEPDARPALICVKSHLIPQWIEVLKEWLPGITYHEITGHKPYDIPGADVYLTGYSRLPYWQDKLLSSNAPQFKTVVGDEVHDLRHQTAEKSQVFSKLSQNADYSVGMSGTPVYNYGDEIFSVLNAIFPECLGDRGDFVREWCDDYGKVKDTEALHNFLKSRGLMMRRKKDRKDPPSRQVITLKADLKTLKEHQQVMKMLAIGVLGGVVGEESVARRQFDSQMRQVTGVAKAKPVAEFVRTLVEQGESVILAGWHHDVYDIWMKELEDLNPVKWVGGESDKQKEAAKKSFIEGRSKVFILSLRSGDGIDGLQHICRTVVFGELDWSPPVMDQVIDRVARRGQEMHVNAYFVVVEDGSDPEMARRANVKRAQSSGIIDGKSEKGLFGDNIEGGDHLREMAMRYLKSIGEEYQPPVKETGLLGDLVRLIRRMPLAVNNEEEMQREMHRHLLNSNLCDVHREFRAGKRMRLDFLCEKDSERVAIECKVTAGDRASVYRQVRKYAENANITSLILVAPWAGVEQFVVDGISVLVVNYSNSSL